jgi:hypothetical protein
LHAEHLDEVAEELVFGAEDRIKDEKKLKFLFICKALKEDASKRRFATADVPNDQVQTSPQAQRDFQSLNRFLMLMRTVEEMRVGRR